MSEAQMKETVYKFCKALAAKNLDMISSLMTEDSSLYWGPYNFSGMAEIHNWTSELFELFPFMSFKEKSIEVKGSIVNHGFMIAFLTTQGRQGWLPCEAEYTFTDNKISQLKIKLLHGFLAVSQDEVERVKPQGTK